MLETVSTFLDHPDLALYIAIPFLTAFVGWATNWIAIKLMFSPVEFVGIHKGWFKLGWQGIIPLRSKKMATILVDNTIAKLSNLSDIFQELEPDKIASHVVAATDARIEEIIDEVMLEKNDILWENIPQRVKQRLYSRIRRQLPKLLDGLVDDISNNIESLIDLKQLVVNKLTTEKDILNRVFSECGEEEMKFVIKSGGMFGFLFGLIQMVVWYVYPEAWVLPAFGFMVGYATNWIALNYIFSPLNPVKIGPFTIQGLFLRRQEAVSLVFARILTSDVLTVGHLMNDVFSGPRSGRARSLIKRHIRPIVDSGVVKTVVQLTVGAEGFVELKRTFEEKAIDVSIETFNDPMFNKDRAQVLEGIFCEKMKSMTPVEYQDLLRPAFKEDEWIPILVGAALGCLAGFGQLVYLFGG